MRHYLIAPRLKADAVNMVGNDLVSGVIQPTTLVGWAHAVALDLGRRGHVVSERGVAVIVHDWSLIGGHPKFSPDPNKDGAPIRDDKLCRATLSLVIDAELGPEGLGDDAGLSLTRALATSVLTRRIGGSPVSASRTPFGAYEAEDLKGALAALGPGHLLVDRSDILEAEHEAGASPLATLIDLVDLRKGDESGWRRQSAHPGFLVPIAIGFRAIEQARPRANPRHGADEHLHAYAETISSVGEYASLRKRLTMDEPLRGALWSPRSNTAAGVHYASARS